MGILRLNELLRENTPSAFMEIPISYFSGRRISIDASYFIHTFFSVSCKQVISITNVNYEDPDKDKIFNYWVNGIIKKLHYLISEGITPIMIFDGDDVPAEKEIARSGRTGKRKKARLDIIDLREKLEGPISEEDKEIEKKLKKNFEKCMSKTGDDISKIIIIIKSLGIPVIQATGEAERLCTALCKQGLTSGVYSNDTDNLPHGCPYLITKIVGSRNATCNVTNLNTILEGLNYDLNQFIDLCIMFGCDYNKNIKGIGLKRAFKLINEYCSIDDLPEKLGKIELNRDSLDYKRCRTLFANIDYTELTLDDEITIDINKDVFGVETRTILNSYGMDGWIRDFINVYLNFPIVKDCVFKLEGEGEGVEEEEEEEEKGKEEETQLIDSFISSYNESKNTTIKRVKIIVLD